MFACLIALAAVGGATAVPDARITVDAAGVTPGEPVVGERTTVNATVSNSAGSPDAAEVTAVRLLDADGDVLDEAAAPGALSPGDDLETELYTEFENPGEHRLTVVVVAEEAVEDDEDEDDPAEVSVERDLFVDVQPAERTVDLRVRARSPADFETESDDGGVNVDGIDGILGGGGGGLDTTDEEPAAAAATAMDSPVAVTVVNTGTVPAERVSLTASGETTGEAATDADSSATPNGSDAAPVTMGPFVVEDIAPGEERQVIVDLGTLDRRSNVTFTATFQSATASSNGDESSRTATAALVYPPHEARPTVTDASVTTVGDDQMAINANIGNAGDADLSGVSVTVVDAPGVTPTPAGEGYFVGSVGSDEFVPFELQTTANATVADTVPLRIEYTDRGVRYVETIELEAPEPPADDDDDSAVGTLGTLGGNAGVTSLPVAGGIVALLGLVVAGAVVRRRRHV
ncbi:MAG: hypothetical protein A07HR67_01077 [uncultured archaeon A07HR67]|nr:MAG: hypothetical protein A07HR67_01077 [uncultured archaeon A07HR67]